MSLLFPRSVPSLKQPTFRLKTGMPQNIKQLAFPTVGMPTIRLIFEPLGSAPFSFLDRLCYGNTHSLSHVGVTNIPIAKANHEEKCSVAYIYP